VLNSVNPYLLFCLILVSYIEEMHLAVMCPSNFFSIIYSGHGFDGFKCCVFGYIYIYIYIYIKLSPCKVFICMPRCLKFVHNLLVNDWND